ncbi:hypothetical protein [Paracoccus fontiphilus]|uniref:Uncharacterized protein n=1 Tax=Paracoccus fontiphilus TaxID=1815556 RepID=A0ABV7IF75_9RHOB|nr:hypothetical protein [Paracoccus fontiphilus]
MTMHFLRPTNRQQIVERADAILLEAEAMRDLAAALGRFEEATGRRVFVSDAVYDTSIAEAQWLADSDAGVYETDMPVEIGGADLPLDLSGIEIENAAQADLGEWVKVEGDGSGEALPPLEADAEDSVVDVHEAPAGEPQPALPSSDRPQAAPAARKQKAEDRPWGKLTLPERQIVKHLERLPKTFTPEDDLRLVELLTGGNKIDAAAAFLEVEPDVALTRWKSFLTEDVIGANGKPTIDGQQRLLNALRYRVETADA